MSLDELERLKRRLRRIELNAQTIPAAIYAKRFRGKRADWIWSFKRRPCDDCGVQHPPYVMQFDHRDGETKKFNLSAAGRRSKAQILEEIAKCDVVCANCHAVRTFERMLQQKQARWERDNG